MIAISSLADLKGALIRVDEVVRRAEEIRSTLSEEQVVGLNTLKANSDSMRNDLHELLINKPDVPEELFPPIDPVTQGMIDESVESLNMTASLLETWLE